MSSLDMSSPQNPKTKTHAKRLNQHQVRLLESSFQAGKKLEPERKFQLARELGVPPRQIAIWYQNKRARWKSQSLELDYGALQLRLEAVLEDNKQLKKQVEGLMGELKRAQDALMESAAVAPPVYSLSRSSCGGDNGGSSSSLNDDVGCSGSGDWETGESLQLVEPYDYACYAYAWAPMNDCDL